MKTSDSMLTYMKHFEGYEDTAYYCSAGELTIGYGHTGPDVVLGRTCTRQQAEVWFKQDVEKAENGVTLSVKVPLQQHQFDALVDFVFNLGVGRLKQSTLLKKLNAGDYDGASDEFKRWVYATNPKTGKKEALDGLIARRGLEAEWFRGELCGKTLVSCL